MHYLNHEDVWLIAEERRARLRDEFSRHRRLRPRPPVDALPGSPSTGGQPPAA